MKNITIDYNALWLLLTSAYIICQVDGKVSKMVVDPHLEGVFEDHTYAASMNCKYLIRLSPKGVFNLIDEGFYTSKDNSFQITVKEEENEQG